MPAKTKAKKARYTGNEVQILEAKDNPMFPEWMTQRMRFLHYRNPIACAHCGKKTRKHWTMLIEFRATDMGMFVIQKSKTVLAPLTPVCDEHPLAPEITE